jgi:hypothetical protein
VKTDDGTYLTRSVGRDSSAMAAVLMGRGDDFVFWCNKRCDVWEDEG